MVFEVLDQVLNLILHTPEIERVSIARLLTPVLPPKLLLLLLLPIRRSVGLRRVVIVSTAAATLQLLIRLLEFTDSFLVQ